MSLPVHWVAELDGVRPGGRVVVEGDEAHHAVAVRRLRVGERLLVTDGAGTMVTAVVAETGRRWLEATVELVEHLARPVPSVTVVQALPKGERGELAVEVLTEIGVERIVPWAASRSVAVWRGERADRSVERWRTTALQAAKQARRAWFPEVSALATTDEVQGLLSSADMALVLHEEAGDALAAVPLAEARAIVLVVGPEGGLSDDEIAGFAGAGARAVHLGSEVLRTSTAGVAAVAALLARTPRWS